MNDATLTAPTPKPAAELPQLPGNLGSATYTAGNIAILLQCSERHVWRMNDSNLIPGRIKLGRLVRFSKKLVDKWIAAGCKPSRSGRG